MKIGFIGLGIMGEPMALNLLKVGFSLTVYNRTPRRMEKLLAAGASGAASPREVAAASEVVITIVTDSPDVEEVVLGGNGILRGLHPGGVVIDMSTISPAVTRKLAAEIEAKGGEMLDAPVSGGDIGAIAGTLAIMVGGKKEVFERCLPVFQAMGKSVTWVGGHGMGQTVKLCNQILGAVTNLAVCEAVEFARKAGVDPLVMIDAVKGGAAGSWQLTNLGPRMTAGNFAPGFMIDLQQKDLRLALEAAREMQLPAPALALVHQLFTGCQAHGEGREGTQALVKSLRRLGGNA
ncbi:MAG TPA: NAD(P)-dependent oxidoreductase [bacterium]|nr:NAD(P)-dependent oxidoreductase [bacterium]HQG46907.1 NAD(P)-dependent oxidoreductase [bacterium]HQJ64535.1 NAD(P)-dependent oxidoreductase [bacterium]